MALNNNKAINLSEEVYDSIPIGIYDLLEICKEYGKLPLNFQKQIEYISEYGISRSIEEGLVQVSALPFIKEFLIAISKNPYFGDAVLQSKEEIYIIDKYCINEPAQLN